MRAVVIHQAGAPQQLIMEERPVPQPKPGWSVIRIRAFGLNHAESITRRGGSPSVQFPRVIGIEGRNSITGIDGGRAGDNPDGRTWPSVRWQL